MNHSEINIAPFLDGEGRVIQLPVKRAKRTAVLAYLAQTFEPGRSYAEREVNELCERRHTFHDYFLVRRELVDAGFLCRKDDGSAYWRAPEPPGQSE